MTYLPNEVLVCLVTAYVVSGCVASASQILQNFENMIIGIIKRFSIRGYEEADLVQECNLEILTRLKKYDPDRGAVSTFITACVNNKLKKLFNKSANNTTVTLDEFNDDEESIYTNILVATNNTEAEALLPLVQQEFVSQCMELAGNKTDQTILRAIMDGRTDECVAKELGIARTTVIHRRQKLLLKLQLNLKPEECYV